MIRLMRRASPLVAFFLLTSAATASAECAWVLWQKQKYVATGPLLMGSSSFGPGWALLEGFSTDTQCRTRIRQPFEVKAKNDDVNWRNLGYRVPPVLGDVIVKIEEVCLPDTVDPRGPKGK
jgi:hypothetical protein